MEKNDFSKLTRRKFMNRSAAALGGIMVSQLPVEAAAYVGGDDLLKVALVGCGGRGTGAAVQALSTKQNVKLVAMADTFKDKVEESYRNMSNMPEIKDRLDVPPERRFVGFDAYKKAIAEADVVLLATPPAFRPTHFETVIDAGKHAFIEKPVAVDAPGIRKVLANIEKAKKKNLAVVVGLQRRFLKVYTEKSVQLLHDGMIGDIIAAQCYWNIGFIRSAKRDPKMGEMEHQIRNWYHYTWLSGDHILDTHIHNIDIVNWVKQGHPIKAQGSGGRAIPYPKGEYGQIFDHHFVEFEYEDGCILSSQCRQIDHTWVKLGEGFLGTKGKAQTDTKKAIITDHKGNELYEYRDRNDPAPQQTEHDVFFASIVEGKPKNDAEYGAYSNMTAIMGRMATYSGKVVTWDEAINSDVSLYPETLDWDAMPPAVPDESGQYPIPKPGVWNEI